MAAAVGGVEAVVSCRFLVLEAAMLGVGQVAAGVVAAVAVAAVVDSSTEMGLVSEDVVVEESVVAGTAGTVVEEMRVEAWLARHEDCR